MRRDVSSVGWTGGELLSCGPLLAPVLPKLSNHAAHGVFLRICDSCMSGQRPSFLVAKDLPVVGHNVQRAGLRDFSSAKPETELMGEIGFEIVWGGGGVCFGNEEGGGRRGERKGGGVGVGVEGRWWGGRGSQTEIDRVVQEAEEYRDGDVANTAKIEATNCLKNYCVTVGNTAPEEQLKFKFGAGDWDKVNKEKIEVVEVVQVILQERVQQRTVEQIFGMPVVAQHQMDEFIDDMVPDAERYRDRRLWTCRWRANSERRRSMKRMAA